ncbi:polysaccharide pyruvyl transferase family protein [Marinobacter sp. F4206]|uniref:polysaccharide pyruvyl transferase family protein n=1 Tax=Marinobacter sp. F4206 TaxID=2861777 RepID=UPI001C5FD345|nr:polysaccharide pyruvyl transferase family protein [Marinobacter sp. F4206]MBW4933787.1 polysaccharide pyruvyl transferase family protein [Marinobacter sp. F4206]
MKVALFYGHYSSNIGDVAINAGLVEYLRRAFGDSLRLRVFFLNSTGEELGGRESFSEFPECEFQSVFSSATEAIKYLASPEAFISDCGVEGFDLVLVNGGEHFFSYHHNENWHNLFWRSLPIIAASASGLRCAVVPSSFGPFETKDSVDFMHNVLGEGPEVAARDARSAEILASQGLLADAPVFTDMAFFLRSDKQRSRQKHQKVLAVTVRPDSAGLRVGELETKQAAERYAASGYSESPSFQSTLAVLRQLLSDQSFTVRLFMQSNADVDLTQGLYAVLSGEFGDSRVSLYRPVSVSDYLRELSACDCIYTSRFHAAILGYVAGTPSVTAYFPEHGHKMPGLYEYLGREQFCFELGGRLMDAERDKIVNAIFLAIDDYPSLHPEIEKRKSETVEWLRQLTTETNDPAPFMSSSEAVQYQPWWPEVVSASERKKVETALRSRNTRHKEVVAARKEAYERVKEREKKLSARVETLARENARLLKKDISSGRIRRLLANLIGKGSG